MRLWGLGLGVALAAGLIFLGSVPLLALHDLGSVWHNPDDMQMRILW
jgi:hypothetical protein